MVGMNSVVNSFVYAIQYHEFQQRTKEMFCRKLDEVDSSVSEGTVSKTIKTNYV